MDLYINDEILDLFRLIKDRNVLARDRFNKRQRLQYLNKLLDKKLKNTIKGKHALTPVKTLREQVELARIDYTLARQELANFTKETRGLRSELQKKFKTKQRKTASNTVGGISIEFLGSNFYFSSSDMSKIILETEINDILLGLPQI
jgi:hypothetical protein